MNIISFDIEEWFLEKEYYGGRSARYQEYDRLLASILDELDKNKIKATFFCLGKIATDFPHIIKKIASKGHEIGCHSNMHQWLNKLSKEEVLADTKDAIMALEDVCGQRVVSYRAPAFSIGETNKWAFEILAECGILRDASVFPAERDFGGFSSFVEDSPTIIETSSGIIKEFPICTTSLMNLKFAFSGGGYFRFFPYNYINHLIKQRSYTMCYFHIADLINEKVGFMTRSEYETYFKENGSLINRCKRFVKSSIGTKSAHTKLNRLINEHGFISLDCADRLIDWSTKPHIIL
ncbi:MAG: polysaccharide deacetylase family protein [Alistipes sp.]|nr:polysaccharide deacetylase family protein [Alistipes sp.]